MHKYDNLDVHSGFERQKFCFLADAPKNSFAYPDEHFQPEFFLKISEKFHPFFGLRAKTLRQICQNCIRSIQRNVSKNIFWKFFVNVEIY